MTTPDLEWIATGSLIPYARNSNKHPERQVAQIAASIKEFGFTNPVIIAKDNTIIAGHGRVLAAQKLGLDKVPCLRFEDWTHAQRQAYVIVDNQLARNSEIDQDLLKVEIQELAGIDYNLDLLGFDDLTFAFDEKKGTEGLTDPDDVPEVPQNIHGVKRGDIWQLGEHRLMCGDSTSREDVEKLMAGEKADMVFTDPPYGGNVGGLKPYTGKIAKERKKAGKTLVFQDRVIQNDKTIDWLAGVFPILPVKEEATKLVFFKWDAFPNILDFASCWGKPSACLVWDRVKRANNFFRFQPQHEFIFHWGNQSDKRETSSLSNVFSVEKDESEIHPTVKPIALLEPIIRVCSSRNESILDPFLGSGSTLIACEKTGRKCYGMEIDPHYCSVIIERWQKFTGREAKLVEG